MASTTLRQRAPAEIAPDPSSGMPEALNVEQPRQQQSQKQLTNLLSSLIMFLWLGSVALGCQLYDGAPGCAHCNTCYTNHLNTGTRPKRHSPMLAAYDLLFRSVGALLPFAILIPRGVGLLLLEGRAFPQTILHKNLMYIYMGMTVLRAVVYNVVLVGAFLAVLVLRRYPASQVASHSSSAQPRVAAKKRDSPWSRHSGTSLCLTTCF